MKGDIRVETVPEAKVAERELRFQAEGYVLVEAGRRLSAGEYTKTSHTGSSQSFGGPRMYTLTRCMLS